MLSNKQEQKTGDNSTSIQATELAIDVTINQGLSYTDVKDIALDVFKANFYELGAKAQEIARSRAEEITESFLNKLEQENANGFAKADDPDFQNALFVVQREYAKCGDKELGDLLVDLLVDRSKQEQRDILQIVLNEALTTAPKLTSRQLTVLTITFMFRYVQFGMVVNLESLGRFFDKFTLPFIGLLGTGKTSCFQHLEFTGCGTVGLSQVTLEGVLESVYQGIFLKGFDHEEALRKGLTIPITPPLFINCLNDPSKLQLNALNLERLNDYFVSNSITSDNSNKLIELFNQNKMSHVEIKEKCLFLRPYMSAVFEAWESSEMKSFTLTSVGMAIAHANIKRLVGEFSDLSIWVN